MGEFKQRVCKLSGVVWKQYNSLEKCNCDECLKAKALLQKEKEMTWGKVPKKQYSIPKVSEKRKIDNLKYSAQRIVFLGKPENKICPITGWPTTDIHHKKGRVGDLFLDERYWVALSREGHQYVEDNPEWAKENGFSLDRLSK